MRPYKNKILILIVAITGATFILTRLILDSGFSNSAAFYVAIPFTVSMLLALLTNPSQRQSAWGEYVRDIRMGTIIMLGTSAFLFEGFLCVLFVMPIYYLMISIGFLFRKLWERSNTKRSKMNVSLIPFAIALLSIEGLSPATSFERQTTVTRSIIVEASIAALKANMARPIELPAQRPLYLSIFPLPTEIEAGSLEAGDIHRLNFVYKRWFVTNTHEGEFALRIDQVEDNYVKTSVLKNTSYFKKYLDIEGTEIQFSDMQDGRTQITLSIHYNRLLDPAWYFAPLQTLAINQSATYLMEHIICREFCDD